jgi:hypothetical protein
MERKDFITPKEVSKRAEKAAKKLLDKHGFKLGDGVEIGLIPDIGTVGLIWRGDLLRKVAGDQLIDIATDMSRMVGRDLGETPVISPIKGGCIVGYCPKTPILFGKDL